MIASCCGKELTAVLRNRRPITKLQSDQEAAVLRAANNKEKSRTAIKNSGRELERMRHQQQRWRQQYLRILAIKRNASIHLSTYDTYTFLL
jgi:hypothetical protein